MGRYTQKLRDDFKFRLYKDGAAPEEVFSPSFDDNGWESVRIPHDWAANGIFESENDASYRSVVQDGITKSIAHTGRTGALPIVGLGVYRKWINIDAADTGRAVFLEFDGIMWDSNIYVNGKHVYFNHFGYKSFSVDISDYVVFGEKNLIAVAASVYEDCSRWYPGAGIYRNARLVIKNKTHIAYNGILVRQTELTDKFASILISAEHSGDQSVRMNVKITSPTGELVSESEQGKAFGELSGIFTIPEPVRWDIDSPMLYRAEITLLDENGTQLDSDTVIFGLRSFEFTANEGFILNGREVKLSGVCMHHDLGSLGAALNVSALKRQLDILRSMGVNAIRTSHNPPAPELLELCDKMGFVVMDEFFDEWHTPKVKNGYAKYFSEHAKKDVEAIVKRDRNHPSIVLWSIGNEIGEQEQKDGWRAAKLLADTTRKFDPTRPITAGLDRPLPAFENHLTDFIDIVGLNYKPHLYRQLHEAHPDKPLYGSETASCVSTRGVYKLPAQHERPVKKHDDLTVSAYELGAPPWASIPEIEWEAQDDLDYVAGEFVWTGFDYLGEPTPYYDEWPSRSSYFGIVDLAGLKKNRYYGYKARWSKEPVLHVFPHWNWEGMEGKEIPVHVYTNYPEVELFINGVSFGRRRPKADDAIERYRRVWNNAVYAPGTLTAIAYDENGLEAARAQVKTADKPNMIKLYAERSAICADGDDLVYVTAAIVDKDGVVCPNANNRLTFEVTGAGKLLTTDAGDQRETESFARADKKALAGYLVACIKAKTEPGEITVSVSGEGLEGDRITIEAKGVRGVRA